MPHMYLEEYEGDYWVIHFANGTTTYVPEDVGPSAPPWLSMGVQYDVETAHRLLSYPTARLRERAEWIVQAAHELGEFIEYGTVERIELLSGTLYRMSAPGYLDATEWTTDLYVYDDDYEDDEGEGED